MTNTITSEDERLGARVGAMLGRRRGARLSLGLDEVRDGARRRRARHRTALGVAVLALVAGSVTVLARRGSDGPVDQPPADTAVVTPTIGAAAVLPASYGDPVSVYATGGGNPRGAPLPAVDVWSDGTTRIVVRTFSRATSGATDDTLSDEPPPTTAAELEPVSRSGQIEEIGEGQWVLYLSGDGVRGDHVIVRGADRASASALVESMVEVDGVLAPSGAFDLVEHADAGSAAEPNGWYAQVGYGAGFGEIWVSANEMTPTRGTLELAASWSLGELRSVGGREVLEQQVDDTRRSMTWIDPSGVQLSVWGYSSAVDDSIVSELLLVSSRELQVIAGELSRRLATEPAMTAVDIDGLRITLRGTRDHVVSCVGTGSDEQCAVDEQASVDSQPLAGAMDATVGDQWVMYGYSEIGEDGLVPDVSDDQFVTAAGTALPVSSTVHDGYLWWVVRASSNDRTIRLAWTNDIGGVVGTIARPLVIGSLG
ncbi:MAG: hypothetical protein AB7L17_03820 [Ilumatobacteraceae bacterium]